MPIRTIFVGLLICSMIVFWGCRQVWRSLGASSEPLVVDIRDVRPGVPLADRHVDLENFLPLLDNSFIDGSTVYIPLVPMPVEGVPDDRFGWQVLARDTRLFATFDEDDLEVLGEGKGLVMGDADSEFSRELRNMLKKDLRVDAVNEIEVIEFGRGPSILWGLLMIGGGFLGLAVVGFIAWSASDE
jgi:hypothetical protein